MSQSLRLSSHWTKQHCPQVCCKAQWPLRVNSEVFRMRRGRTNPQTSAERRQYFPPTGTGDGLGRERRNFWCLEATKPLHDESHRASVAHRRSEPSGAKTSTSHGDTRPHGDLRGQRRLGHRHAVSAVTMPAWRRNPRRQTLDQVERRQHQAGTAARPRLRALVAPMLGIVFTQALQRAGRPGTRPLQEQV